MSRGVFLTLTLLWLSQWLSIVSTQCFKWRWIFLMILYGKVTKYIEWFVISNFHLLCVRCELPLYYEYRSTRELYLDEIPCFTIWSGSFKQYLLSQMHFMHCTKGIFLCKISYHLRGTCSQELGLGGVYSRPS